MFSRWRRKDAVSGCDNGGVPNGREKEQKQGRAASATGKSYREATNLALRRQQVASIQAKFPGKIPVSYGRCDKYKCRLAPEPLN